MGDTMTLLLHIERAHMVWFQEWFTATHGPHTADNEALWRNEYIHTWEALKTAIMDIRSKGYR